MEWQIGIDTIAHKTTLEYRGKTIAVLGNGFNHIFPKENKALYYDIIKNGGLIISEYPPETKAESKYFIARNRIVSGISIGVLIVEAAYRSGTSVTAKLATEQNKKVFVLPHEIDDIHGVGTNRLIRKGAILVTSTQEIIEEYEFLEYRKVQKRKIKNTKENTNTKEDFYIKNQIEEIDEIVNKSKNNKEKNNISMQMKKKILKKELFNEKYQEIYDLITTETININEIYKKTNMQLNEVNQILFFLEIEGYIEKIAGGYRCILSKE